MTSSNYYLDGIELDTIEVVDELAMAVAEYSSPYIDGPSLENMGLKGKQVRIKCAFMDERYAEYGPFCDKVFSGKEDSHELSHPDFGLLFGSVLNLTGPHNDLKDTVIVDLVFICEGKGTQSGPVFYPSSVAASLEDRLNEGQAALQVSAGETMAGTLGGESSEVLDAEIDPEQTLLEQFISVSAAGRAYLEEMDNAIAICEGHLAGVEIASSSFFNTIDYGTKLPGRVIGAIAAACERICASGASDGISPASWLHNLKDSFSSFHDLFSNGTYAAADQVLLVQAQRYGLETAYVYKKDNASALALKNTEAAESFDVLGRRILSGDQEAIMTIDDIDDSLYNARELLQEAIDLDRDNPVYKKMATELLSHADVVRLQRHRIVTVQLAGEMPLHILCFNRGLPVNMADRILALNPQIENPSFVSGDIKVYA